MVGIIKHNCWLGKNQIVYHNNRIFVVSTKESRKSLLKQPKFGWYEKTNKTAKIWLGEHKICADKSTKLVLLIQHI